MKPHQHLNAYQESDEMVCTTCRCRWDVNDPDPPECRPPQQRSRADIIADMRGVTDGCHNCVHWKKRSGRELATSRRCGVKSHYTGKPVYTDDRMICPDHERTETRSGLGRRIV